MKYIQYSCDFLPREDKKFSRQSVHVDLIRPSLDAANKYASDKKLTEVIHHLLEDSADSYYEKMINGEDISGYIGVPYILLYEMMKQERTLILQYQAEIETLS